MTAPEATDPRDEHAMRLALDQAHNAWLVGEVPVGAVILRNGQVIATGYNRPITTHDPTAHAELVALRHAATLLENYRLPECELFVTLEPCPMCAMALMHARFKRVVFGAPDPKTGAAGGVVNLFADSRLNHHTQIEGGVLSEACGSLLRSFFAERRAARKAEKDAERALGMQAGPDATTQVSLASDPSAGAVTPRPLHIGPGTFEGPADDEAAESAPIPTGDVTELDPSDP